MARIRVGVGIIAGVIGRLQRFPTGMRGVRHYRAFYLASEIVIHAVYPPAVLRKDRITFEDKPVATVIDILLPAASGKTAPHLPAQIVISIDRSPFLCNITFVRKHHNRPYLCRPLRTQHPSHPACTVIDRIGVRIRDIFPLRSLLKHPREDDLAFKVRIDRLAPAVLVRCDRLFKAAPVGRYLYRLRTLIISDVQHLVFACGHSVGGGAPAVRIIMGLSRLA